MFSPLRELHEAQTFGKGDTLVVFGEVFERGYVNGLIDIAKARGLNVVYTTVGRRHSASANESQSLRALTAEELTEKGQSPLINIPLEAGFDLDPGNDSDANSRPVDQLKGYGLTGWEDARLDWQSIERSRQRGVERFRDSVKQFLVELRKHADVRKNLIFAHTMAGGFPRAKVVMPIANKIFKGSGARYSSSEVFWSGDIGRLCAMSFQEVTAETYRHLIELSTPLRSEIESNGASVHYLGFGYHGNEALIGDKYEWYSYSPYLQGYAKIQLENISKEAFAAGVKSTVFNVPEILTNSSSIFLGVEVSLYSLLRALKKEGPGSPRTREILERAKAKLKDGATLDDIDRITQQYLTNPAVRDWPKFEGWPQHNGPEQMELMRSASSALIDLHKNPKDLMTAELSEVVFRACGKVMFNEIAAPRAPVAWIGHDLVAKLTV